MVDAKHFGGNVMELDPPQSDSATGTEKKKRQEKIAVWWNSTAKPEIAKAFAAFLKAMAALAAFYKAKIHPTLSLSTSPEKRAIAAGRYLCRLAVTYGILSIIGAVILALITSETNECIDRAIFSDSCYEYATERPFLTWAIVSLLISLIVASFLFAFGSYVEARMKKQLSDM